MLVAGQRLDGRSRHGIAGDRAQRQAIAAQRAAVGHDAIEAGVGAQRADLDVQGRVIEGNVAADSDVVAGTRLRDRQACITGLEIENPVVDRQIAVHDEIAVGNAGGRVDPIARRDSGISRHVQIAIDRTKACDGAVRRCIDVSTDRHARSTAVTADNRGAAVDVDSPWEVGRSVKNLRIARSNGQVRGRNATPVGRAQGERRRQPFLCAVCQNIPPDLIELPLTRYRYA
ncbi:hypothetical protein D3C86_1270430 [compost metagenome]